MNKYWLCVLCSLLLIIMVTACNIQSESASSEKNTLASKAESKINPSFCSSDSKLSDENTSAANKVNFIDNMEWKTISVRYRQIYLESISLTSSNNILQSKIIGDVIYIQYWDDSILSGSYIGMWNLTTGQLLKRITTESRSSYQLDQEYIVLLEADHIDYYNLNLQIIKNIQLDPNNYEGNVTLPQLSISAKEVLFIGERYPVIYNIKANQTTIIDSVKYPDELTDLSYSYICATNIKNCYYLIASSNNDVFYHFYYDISKKIIKNYYRAEHEANQLYMLYANLSNASFYIQENEFANFSTFSENGITANWVCPVTDNCLQIIDLNDQTTYVTNAPLKDTWDIELLAVNSNGTELACILSDQNLRNQLIIFYPEKSDRKN